MKDFTFSFSSVLLDCPVWLEKVIKPGKETLFQLNSFVWICMFIEMVLLYLMSLFYLPTSPCFLSHLPDGLLWPKLQCCWYSSNKGFSECGRRHPLVGARQIKKKSCALLWSEIKMAFKVCCTYISEMGVMHLYSIQLSRYSAKLPLQVYVFVVVVFFKECLHNFCTFTIENYVFCLCKIAKPN